MLLHGLIQLTVAMYMGGGGGEERGGEGEGAMFHCECVLICETVKTTLQICAYVRTYRIRFNFRGVKPRGWQTSSILSVTPAMYGRNNNFWGRPFHHCHTSGHVACGSRSVW